MTEVDKYLAMKGFQQHLKAIRSNPSNPSQQGYRPQAMQTNLPRPQAGQLRPLPGPSGQARPQTGQTRPQAGQTGQVRPQQVRALPPIQVPRPQVPIPPVPQATPVSSGLMRWGNVAAAPAIKATNEEIEVISLISDDDDDDDVDDTHVALTRGGETAYHQPQAAVNDPVSLIQSSTHLQSSSLTSAPAVDQVIEPATTTTTVVDPLPTPSSSGTLSIQTPTTSPHTDSSSALNLNMSYNNSISPLVNLLMAVTTYTKGDQQRELLLAANRLIREASSGAYSQSATVAASSNSTEVEGSQLISESAGGNDVATTLQSFIQVHGSGLPQGGHGVVLPSSLAVPLSSPPFLFQQQTQVFDSGIPLLSLSSSDTVMSPVMTSSSVSQSPSSFLCRSQMLQVPGRPEHELNRPNSLLSCNSSPPPSDTMQTKSPSVSPIAQSTSPSQFTPSPSSSPVSPCHLTPPVYSPTKTSQSSSVAPPSVNVFTCTQSPPTPLTLKRSKSQSAPTHYLTPSSPLKPLRKTNSSSPPKSCSLVQRFNSNLNSDNLTTGGRSTSVSPTSTLSPSQSNSSDCNSPPERPTKSLNQSPPTRLGSAVTFRYSSSPSPSNTSSAPYTPSSIPLLSPVAARLLFLSTGTQLPSSPPEDVDKLPPIINRKPMASPHSAASQGKESRGCCSSPPLLQKREPSCPVSSNSGEKKQCFEKKKKRGSSLAKSMELVPTSTDDLLLPSTQVTASLMTTSASSDPPPMQCTPLPLRRSSSDTSRNDSSLVAAATVSSNTSTANLWAPKLQTQLVNQTATTYSTKPPVTKMISSNKLTSSSSKVTSLSKSITSRFEQCLSVAQVPAQSSALSSLSAPSLSQSVATLPVWSGTSGPSCSVQTTHYTPSQTLSSQKKDSSQLKEALLRLAPNQPSRVQYTSAQASSAQSASSVPSTNVPKTTPHISQHSAKSMLQHGSNSVTVSPSLSSTVSAAKSQFKTNHTQLDHTQHDRGHAQHDHGHTQRDPPAAVADLSTSTTHSSTQNSMSVQHSHSNSPTHPTSSAPVTSVSCSSVMTLATDEVTSASSGSLSQGLRHRVVSGLLQAGPPMTLNRIQGGAQKGQRTEEAPRPTAVPTSRLGAVLTGNVPSVSQCLPAPVVSSASLEQRPPVRHSSQSKSLPVSMTSAATSKPTNVSQPNPKSVVTCKPSLPSTQTSAILPSSTTSVAMNQCPLLSSGRRPSSNLSLADCAPQEGTAVVNDSSMNGTNNFSNTECGSPLVSSPMQLLSPPGPGSTLPDLLKSFTFPVSLSPPVERRHSVTAAITASSSSSSGCRNVGRPVQHRPQVQTSLKSPDHQRNSPVLSHDRRNSSPVLSCDHQRSSPVLSHDLQRSSSVLSPEHKRSSPVLVPSSQRSSPLLSPDHQRSSPVLSHDLRRSSSVLSPEHKRSSPVLVPNFQRSSSLLSPDHQRSSPMLQHLPPHQSATTSPHVACPSAPQQQQSSMGPHVASRSLVGAPQQQQSSMGPHVASRSLVSAPQQQQSSMSPHVASRSLVGAPQQQQQSSMSPHVASPNLVSAPQQQQSSTNPHVASVSIVSAPQQQQSSTGPHGSSPVPVNVGYSATPILQHQPTTQASPSQHGETSLLPQNASQPPPVSPSWDTDSLSLLSDLFAPQPSARQRHRSDSSLQNCPKTSVTLPSMGEDRVSSIISELLDASQNQSTSQIGSKKLSLVGSQTTSSVQRSSPTMSHPLMQQISSPHRKSPLPQQQQVPSSRKGPLPQQQQGPLPQQHQVPLSRKGPLPQQQQVSTFSGPLPQQQQVPSSLKGTLPQQQQTLSSLTHHHSSSSSPHRNSPVQQRPPTSLNTQDTLRMGGSQMSPLWTPAVVCSQTPGQQLFPPKQATATATLPSLPKLTPLSNQQPRRPSSSSPGGVQVHSNLSATHHQLPVTPTQHVSQFGGCVTSAIAADHQMTTTQQVSQFGGRVASAIAAQPTDHQTTTTQHASQFGGCVSTAIAAQPTDHRMTTTQHASQFGGCVSTAIVAQPTDHRRTTTQHVSQFGGYISPVTTTAQPPDHQTTTQHASQLGGCFSPAVLKLAPVNVLSTPGSTVVPPPPSQVQSNSAAADSSTTQNLLSILNSLSPSQLESLLHTKDEPPPKPPPTAHTYDHQAGRLHTSSNNDIQPTASQSQTFTQGLNFSYRPPMAQKHNQPSTLPLSHASTPPAANFREPLVSEQPQTRVTQVNKTTPPLPQFRVRSSCTSAGLRDHLLQLDPGAAACSARRMMGSNNMESSASILRLHSGQMN